MVAPIEIFVIDSCVLFDLIDLGLIQAFFDLKYKTYTTHYVLSEFSDQEQDMLINQYVQTNRILIDSQISINVVHNLYIEYPGLSLTDCSVLSSAEINDCILLSSDKRLRNVATRKGLKVRGVLWIINELVEKKMITASEAITSLKEYPAINSRVPLNAINKIIIELEAILTT